METPETILEWGRATFGPNTPFNIAVRANVELAELLSAIENSTDLEHISGEIADVWIVFSQVVAFFGIELKDRELRDSMMASPRSCALKLNFWFASLLSQLSQPGLRPPVVECLYVNDYLQMLARLYEIELAPEVDKKMKINRARKWGKTEGGRHQHV